MKVRKVQITPKNDFNRSEWYSKFYSCINATADTNSLSSRILHKSIESDFASNAGLKLLEVGGNIGEHLPFVSKDFDEYILTDIRSIDNQEWWPSKTKFIQADICKLPFVENTFDRVISTCVFHHLDSPEQAFREVRRITKPGGVITIFIPNDPGLMYRILRGLTTIRKARALGLSKVVSLVHALEHKNHYLALMTISDWVFQNDNVKKNFFFEKVKKNK
jgi:ubiquinone/menaquinone biosynthesis C-methylase UbiE